MALLRILLNDIVPVVVFVGVFLIDVGITEEEIGSPLRVAQCRARCLQRFSTSPDTYNQCLQGPDCNMCWENCQLLQSNFPVWGAICSEKGICFPGCQQACQFHLEKMAQRAPVLVTRGEEVLTLSGEMASWPHPGSSDSGPYVYVVMRRLPMKTWRQITQTLDLTARIPSGTLSGIIRVLVVNRDGLVTIYSPETKSVLSNAEAIIRSLGRDSLFGLGYPAVDLPSAGQGKRINTEILSATTVDPLSIMDDPRDNMWNLREISLIHQKVLVIAEIAWDPQSPIPTSRAVYFVTWEVDGGGLKGNLFTDSTCVTLSLWPDTIYHIQVELVSHNSQHPDQSEELVLDTHRALAVEFETPLPPPAGDVTIHDGTQHGTPRRVAVKPKPHLELVAGVGAAVVVFLAVLAGLTWRWRRYPSLPGHSKLVQDDVYTPNLSRVFPPVVTLVADQSAISTRNPRVFPVSTSCESTNVPSTSDAPV